ncbi:MAG TPA: ABC transporter ATP-binding protein [Euzebya sp.]|nr:ABC transporter ATP-binding protein [Euzebya sp.]
MMLAVTRSVVKRFGQVTAVAGVDLAVGPGEVVGLLGANGAGKTTLIRMLLGLVVPTAGHVELFGETPSRATRRRTGYVPQGLGLYEDLTVAENLAFAAAAFDIDRHMPADIGEVSGVLVRDLPLGWRRRVAFGAALQHRPDLLVLDEPTSGVDALGRSALWDTIRMAAERGAGVVVTTHHMDEAEECDRLVMMASGKVVTQGTLTEVVHGSTVVIAAPSWAQAFDVLEAAGVTVALTGDRLRAPGADADHVRQVLRSHGIEATVQTGAATLDEVFARVVADAA